MKTALTIAGSDSVGGAGIQTDIKAMASLGVHGASVITAVTAQNTMEVSRIFPIPADVVEAQLKAVLKDCNISAAKTGMLYNSEIVEIVADIMEDHETPLIVDPVMVATVGDTLSENDLPKTLKRSLLPICELVTPNKHEAEVLSGMKIRNADDAMLACEIIGKEGSSVLLKGGHMDTSNIIDYLYLSSEFIVMKNPRLNRAGHGSGCALSSFITANLAKGLDLVNAVMRSRELIQRSIESQYAIGKGEVVVNSAIFDDHDADRFEILSDVETAAKRCIDTLPQRLVPDTGMNIGFATTNPAGPKDIAGIEGKIRLQNGRMTAWGSAKFGSADHLSYIIMGMMEKHPEMRCAANISADEEILDIMEETGLNIVRTKRKGADWTSTMKNILSGREIPDVIIDEKDRRIIELKILGRDPSDVLSKIDSVLN